MDTPHIISTSDGKRLPGGSIAAGDVVTRDASTNVLTGVPRAGVDTSAIHDDVAGEISALTEKASPVSADLLLIEDSAAANAKKKVQIGNLPAGSSLPVADTTAIAKGSVDATKQVRFEVDGLTTGTTRVLTVPDADVTLGTDAAAIHDNVSGEIAAVAEKLAPVGDDLLLIEDSAASNAKKRIKISNLPSVPGGDSSVQTTNATPTTLHSEALADDTTYLMIARIVGRDQAGSKRAAYVRTALVYRQSTGAATLGGAGVQADFTDETTAAWNASIVVSGNNAIVQVTGEAATTIDWTATVELISVNDGSLDQVQTTDATPTTLSTIALADNSVYVVEARIVARDTGGTKRATYVRTVMAYRQAAGSATLGGAGVEDDFTDETTAAWNATFVVSGNNLLVQVTGEAATTIDWAADVVSTKVSG